MFKKNIFFQFTYPKSIVFILVISLSFVFACEEPESIGADIVPQQGVEVLFTDTMQVDISTVLAENIETSSSLNLLAGSYDDPELGTIKAESYFQMNSAFDPIQFVLNDGEIATFDSLVLRLGFGYKYGKSDIEQTFRLYKLKEGERFPSENENDDISDNIIFTNQSTALELDDSEYLEFKLTGDDFQEDGTVDFLLDRSNNLDPDTFENLGEEILNFMQSSSNTRSNFLTDFPGFAIVPEDGEAIIGFSSTSSSLILYYRTDALQTESDIFTFFPSLGQRFCRIENEADPFNFQPLVAKSSTELSNKAYIQAGLGLMTKVEFPNLLELDAQSGNAAINLAELVIKVKDPIDEQLPPPSQLILYETNADNQFLLTDDTPYNGFASLLDENNRVVNVIQVITDLNAGTNNSIVQPTFDERNREYRFNITSYLQNVLNGQENNNSFLISTLPFRGGFGGLSVSTSPSVNRVVLDLGDDDFDVELRLFYTKFE